MAETKQQEQAAVSQQPTQQQGRPCPKDCRKCSWMQQVCCSSMMSFQMFDVMNGMMQKIDNQTNVIIDLNGRVAELEDRMNNIQPGDDLISPSPIEGDLFPKEK